MAALPWLLDLVFKAPVALRDRILVGWLPKGQLNVALNESGRDASYLVE